MSTSAMESLASSPPIAKPTGNYRTPPGHRILHVVIPDATFTLLHKAALDSGMKFTQFMNRFLTEAHPYNHPVNLATTDAIPSNGTVPDHNSLVTQTFSAVQGPGTT